MLLSYKWMGMGWVGLGGYGNLCDADNVTHISQNPHQTLRYLRGIVTLQYLCELILKLCFTRALISVMLRST